MRLAQLFRRGKPVTPAASAEAKRQPASNGIRHFESRLPSLSKGLYFCGRFSSTVTLSPQCSVGTRHANAVARAMLRQKAVGITSGFHPLDFREAEDAVNAVLSLPSTVDPQLTVQAHVSICLDPDTKLLADRQLAAEQALAVAHHEKTVRLELLRDRLLDPNLGLLSWLDQHAETLNASDVTKARVDEVISAFQTLHTTLLRSGSPEPTTASTLIRARVDILLSALEDPAVATAAARVLQQLVNLIHHEHEEDLTSR
ncbi:hypothetical protein [Streptomyces harbinensis]|uniref:Uncharacterized protein n=1 Tax=Streptomyces harbinensis TaxID=1176198 RepID=A0A1I6UGF3_9ACTN|nr:hypothetical protein [Streptomyces harbinensis]SFT00468.1 hypothetical protein SAMN05444716_105553 [Streptomyces harbinensis]